MQTRTLESITNCVLCMLAKFCHNRSPFTVPKNTISTRAQDEILTDVPFPSGWERLDSTFKRLGTVGFHFQAVGNGWFPFPSGWERLVSTFKRLGTVGFHFQAVGNG